MVGVKYRQQQEMEGELTSHSCLMLMAWVLILAGWMCAVCVNLCCAMFSHSHVQLFASPQSVAHQASVSMEFSRQEYQSGLTFLPPGDLPDPGIEPMSRVSPALAGGFFTIVPPGKPLCLFLPCEQVHQYNFSRFCIYMHQYRMFIFLFLTYFILSSSTSVQLIQNCSCFQLSNSPSQFMGSQRIGHD